MESYAAGNVVIALVGDLSREDAEAIAAQVSPHCQRARLLTKNRTPVQHEATRPPRVSTKQTIRRPRELGVERDDRTMLRW